ncbi:MAG: hypothetical protein LBR07_03440 [Puniceicoccales bacterium]|nr:hypothetical protein [Puniceicoccales bacterium]
MSLLFPVFPKIRAALAGAVLVAGGAFAATGSASASTGTAADFAFEAPAAPLPADWAALQKAFSAKEPPATSRSRPLWFWNEVPTKERTYEQIEACAKAGYSGLAILPGFDQRKMKFMSPAFLEQYRHAADAAKKFGLKLCLYDEYWFPSGSAGGLLREKFPQHLCKRLDAVTAEIPAGNTAGAGNTAAGNTAAGTATLTVPAGEFMGAVAMNLRTFERTNISANFDTKTRSLRWTRPAGTAGTAADAYKIFAFVCVPDGQRNLVDYLEPESVRAFISLTYAAYAKALPEHFGTTIDSAFYDEPMLYTPGNGRAWTPRFNEYFRAAATATTGTAADPLLLYPALFTDIGPETAAARNALLSFRATLFAEGWVKTIQDFLRPYKMPLTGHLDQEEVANPCGVTGDVIKFFRHQPIAGLDQVFAYGRGSPIYKLVSSAAANYRRHLVMTETYGATKRRPVRWLWQEAMDQAAKGINVFVPHAVWYRQATAGGKRTMPPDLSPGTHDFGRALPEYNRFIGRLQLLLQQPGPNAADIALLYPIDSLQAAYHFNGPLRAYQGGVRSDDEDYFHIGELLSLTLRRDFLYVHPDTFDAFPFRTLIVPHTRYLAPATLAKIAAFERAGGRVIWSDKLAAGSAKKITAGELAAALDAATGAPDVAFLDAATLPAGTPTGSVQYLHRRILERDVFLFTNSHEREITTRLTLRTTAGTAGAAATAAGAKPKTYSWWDPHTGAITPATPSAGNFTLRLPAVHAVFLIENADFSK